MAHGTPTPVATGVTRALGWLPGLLALIALALHLPGEASFDTSIQLLEAHTGVSRSWNPPFMSALLQAFGGGSQAMALFVVLSTLLTYGGLALALGRPRPRSRRASVLGALILANPVILLYVGIVWKDVLFAALLCLACGACLAATRTAPDRRRWGLALLAGIALVLAAHVRQQGLLLLPLLALCPLLAAAPLPGPRLGWSLAWILLLAAVFTGVGAWTDGRISHVEGLDRDRGVRRIMTFDILGTAAVLGTPIPGIQASVEDIRAAYSPARVDTLSSRPLLGRQFRAMPTPALRALWWHTISSEPIGWIRHRLGVAAHVLNLAELDRCLPVHVGIEGDRSALTRVGLLAGSDARDQWKYQASLPLHWTPWFRHFATLAALVAILALGWHRRSEPAARVALWFAAAMVAYTLATALFAIACDFRYLYPAITVASACALGLLVMRQRIPGGVQ